VAISGFDCCLFGPITPFVVWRLVGLKIVATAFFGFRRIDVGVSKRGTVAACQRYGRAANPPLLCRRSWNVAGTVRRHEPGSRCG
jgi:hypothetical protein